MKTLILSIFCVFLTSGICYSQNVPDSVFLYVDTQLDASRDSVSKLLKQVRHLDSAYTHSEKEHIQDSIAYHNQNLIIETLKNELTAKPVDKPLIQWNGFHLGLSAMYQFSDSILTKSTVLNGTQYAIEGIAGITITDKLLLNGIIGIPLSKEKFYLKIYMGYKIF
jgi:hypothetical protein